MTIRNKVERIIRVVVCALCKKNCMYLEVQKVNSVDGTQLIQVWIVLYWRDWTLKENRISLSVWIGMKKLKLLQISQGLHEHFKVARGKILRLKELTCEFWYLFHRGQLVVLCRVHTRPASTLIGGVLSSKIVVDTTCMLPEFN